MASCLDCWACELALENHSRWPGFLFVSPTTRSIRLWHLLRAWQDLSTSKWTFHLGQCMGAVGLRLLQRSFSKCLMCLPWVIQSADHCNMGKYQKGMFYRNNTLSWTTQIACTWGSLFGWHVKPPPQYPDLSKFAVLALVGSSGNYVIVCTTFSLLYL